MVESLTIAYVLPDDAEHACEAFSIPATRLSGAACAVKWDGAEGGHELAVNENAMRAYAEKPRVAFTITREAPCVVPGDASGDVGDAEADGAPPAARGAPVVSAVEVDLASVMLGSRRAATATFGAAPDADADEDANAIFGVSAAPMPEALRGFASAAITVSLDPFDAAADESEALPETDEKAFLPPGLASAMEPFAVTVTKASSLPDAPATRDELRLCAPVACRVRWAGMPVATIEAARGETDWVPLADADGADFSGARREVGDDAFPERSRTYAREVTFGRSVLWFGCDVPRATYPRGLVDACGEPVQVRVYDRTAPRAPDPFPVSSVSSVSSTETAARDAEKASDAPDEDANAEDDDGDENGTDEETKAAREAEKRESRARFPADDAAYGFASFDVARLARKSHAPIQPRASDSTEAPLVPCAMSRSNAASWRTRPGRFVEAGSTVSVAVEFAVRPCDREAKEVKEAADAKEEETAERDEGDEKETEEPTARDAPTANEPTVSLPEERPPFVRATCTFPSDDAPFLRAVIAATRAQNAKALGVDDAVAEDDARLRFHLARAEVAEARALDPNFHLVTGYHLVDGQLRQVTVEGTPEAVAPVAALFAARRAETNAATSSTTSSRTSSTTMDESARFARRAYHLLPKNATSEPPSIVFAGDVFFGLGVRLRDAMATIVAEPGTHVGDRVSPEAREGLRRARALAEPGTRARRAAESNLYPDPAMLRALDRAFGVALRPEDVCADEASTPSEPGPLTAKTVSETEAMTKRGVKAFPSLDDPDDPSGFLDRDASRKSLTSSSPRARANLFASKKTRVKKHPPLTVENSAYLARLARERAHRTARDVHAEVHVATIERLAETRGAAKRDAWAEWNVRRPARDAFESELETARRHPTASTKPAPPPTPAWGRTHNAPFTWPAAHDAAASRVPAAKRPPQSRLDELAQPWEEPPSEHFPTKYFASAFFPGGALDATKSRAAERRGGEALAFPKPFDARVRNETRDGAFYADARERALWENPEEAASRAALDARDAKSAKRLNPKPWRDATAPRLRAPAQTDKTRGLLRDPPARKALSGKYVKGAAQPPPHSMFLDEPPADLRGLSLDETFLRSLRRGALDAAEFLEGSTRLDPSTFVAGKDFVRHNVGTRSMRHTGRSAGVGEVAPPRTRAQRRAR